MVSMPPRGDGPWVLLRPSAPLTLEQAIAGNIPKNFRPVMEGSSADAWRSPDELVLAKATKQKVMIATQTCDLVRRRYVQVLPIHALSIIESEHRRESMRANKIISGFYLPSAPPELSDESYADMNLITSVHRSYVRNSVMLKRLSALARVHFQARIAEFFGRPFGFNVTDEVPQQASYLCVRCFLSSATVSQLDMQPGPSFAECPGCGPAALWIKYR